MLATIKDVCILQSFSIKTNYKRKNHNKINRYFKMLTRNACGLLLFTILVVILLPLNESFELPFLQSCTFDDEGCHIKKVDQFFEMYANGIKELDVAAFDPMYLGNITINGNTNKNFNLQLLMENVILHKFPEAKCLGVKGFTTDSSKPISVVMKFFSPHLIVKAHCRVKGQILLFKLLGEADLRIDIKNVTTIMKTELSVYTKDGQSYYKVEKMKPKLIISSLTNSFANSTLFNGEEIFMETFTSTMNENWEILRDEIEPHLNNNVANVTMQALNNILPTLPHNKFFKKSE